ncbi:WAT1-related protein At5g64700-like [Typha angustifolia]|uniref:WAT1-related protein At5g64700-like n=1 Tax=Typha angustifolia TaxID=59011 RepID=UPI003C2CC144
MSSMKACAPYIGMVIIQLAYGGSNILSKLALEQGLSFPVFIVYRHLIAMIIFTPVALLLERKQRPSISSSIVAKIFLLALFGITIHQNVFYAGLDCTSATVASALSNIIPALTFILAVLLKMEKVRIKSTIGKAKLLGTICCIGGALIFTFWKGHLLMGFVREPLIALHSKGPGHGTVHGEEDWIKGSLLILTSHIAFSAWLILQAVVFEVYPAKLSMNAMLCFFASLQSSAVALIFERDKSSWQLGWNIQLLTIIYCATVISCLSYYLQTFCISERGPVFAAMFNPLLLVIVSIFSAFFFAERLHIGSLIGAFIIIAGLYCFLWGKSREIDKKMKEIAETSLVQKQTSSNEC